MPVNKLKFTTILLPWNSWTNAEFNAFCKESPGAQKKTLRAKQQSRDGGKEEMRTKAGNSEEMEGKYARGRES